MYFFMFFNRCCSMSNLIFIKREFVVFPGCYPQNVDIKLSNWGMWSLWQLVETNKQDLCFSTSPRLHLFTRSFIFLSLSLSSTTLSLFYTLFSTLPPLFLHSTSSLFLSILSLSLYSLSLSFSNSWYVSLSSLPLWSE